MMSNNKSLKNLLVYNYQDRFIAANELVMLRCT